jgi:hypothetical protein
MSDQSKLEFAEWIKVRDVVTAKLEELGESLVRNGELDAKETAEELMVAGLIDIAAILGEPVVEDEPLGAEWTPTHVYEYRVRDVVTSLPVRVTRAIGNNRVLAEFEGGNTDVVAVEFLTEISA